MSRHEASFLRGAAALFCTSSALLLGDITVIDLGQGHVPIDPNGFSRVEELSGITWVGGDRYYTVSDDNAVFELTVVLDPLRGTVKSERVTGRVASSLGVYDPEDIAYDVARNRMLIVSEALGEIREYSLDDWTQLRNLTLPEQIDSVYSTKGLESLSLQFGGHTLWTANEEALTTDGVLATTTTGTVVRLYRLDETYTPNGQWAYQADPVFVDYPPEGRGFEDSAGVPGLIALPCGELIVIERSGCRSHSPAYHDADVRVRLYATDFTGAEDVSLRHGLIGTNYTPVQKELLWEGVFPGNRYEGITLGPQVDTNKYAALLIADEETSGGLYPLIIQTGGAPDRDGDGLSDYWESTHGSDLDPLADNDGDRMSNMHEYLCGTDPGNATSVLAITHFTAGPSNATVAFPSVPFRNYTVQRGALQKAESWERVATFAGDGSVMTHVEPLDAGKSTGAYRIRLSR